MSKHLFGMVLTHQGIYANNRGENEGNTNTLQKVLHKGDLFTTVSAEAIRYALRDVWQEGCLKLNRTTNDHRSCVFKDKKFEKWHENLDDDVLGFMHASKETLSRRGILEITRAISTTPWRGEVMHNFASSGSNPSVKDDNPIPYSIEVHDTRYQYGVAMTPEFLGRNGMNSEETLDAGEKKSRIQYVLEGITNLKRVGGNHARYLTDYSPEVLVLRWTDDPVPRFLNCFEQDEHGVISVSSLISKIKGGDIDAGEIFLGSAIEFEDSSVLKDLGANVFPGVKQAVKVLLAQIKENDLMRKEGKK